jgi:hypothetical protein
MRTYSETEALYHCLKAHAESLGSDAAVRAIVWAHLHGRPVTELLQAWLASRGCELAPDGLRRAPTQPIDSSGTGAAATHESKERQR